MGVGRKRTPDYLKLLKGTAQKCRMHPNAPVAVHDTPQPPEWLTDRGKEIFRLLVARLDALHYASVSHTEIIALAALRQEEVEHCTAFIVEYTHRMKTKGVTEYKHRPEVGLRSDAAKHLQSLLAELGLTPAAMGKIEVPSSAKKKNAFDDV